MPLDVRPRGGSSPPLSVLAPIVALASSSWSGFTAIVLFDYLAALNAALVDERAVALTVVVTTVVAFLAVLLTGTSPVLSRTRFLLHHRPPVLHNPTAGGFHGRRSAPGLKNPTAGGLLSSVSAVSRAGSASMRLTARRVTRR